MNEPETFNEYYQYYLTLHQNNVNRWLHIVGQCVTVFYISIRIIYSNLAFIAFGALCGLSICMDGPPCI